jgi:CxxC motif-containing protein (DUF1111 family)
MQRTVRKTTLVFIAATGVFVLLLAQWQTHSQTPVPTCQAQKLAKPLPGVLPGSDEEKAFFAGCDEFMEVETIEDGLGPVFNGKSCAECHAVPSVGGVEPNQGVARETRIGRLLPDGRFDPLDGSVSSLDRGGPLLQQRAINLQGCQHLQGEVVPPEATIVSLRLSTPLFGAGLIEAIPEATILANTSNGGRPNRVSNPDRGDTRTLGRFGWKAQVPTLHVFAGDAYLNELGVTNPSFPQENRPQGEKIPSGCDIAPTRDNPNGLDDDGPGVTAFTNFMQFLAPLQRQPVTPQVQRGEEVFSSNISVGGIGCASCHIPTMNTGPNPVAALSNKDVNLFSDLLLHNIGTGDGIEQGQAKGNDFRTAPLWGLSRRDRFMHDGKSKTIQDAILRHGAPEALNALNGFMGLSQSDHDALLALLGSL